MNALNWVILTILIVIAGKWSDEKPISISIVAGGMVYGTVVAMVSGSNPRLANNFALLVLVAAAFLYLPSTLKKTGFTK